MDNNEFLNPKPIYRGAPFWAWNCKINKNVLKEQIAYFKEMGMGGFHIHSRTGLDTEYLGKEFMEMVVESNKIGKDKEMLTYLYDEDRYPSGYGGGYVTEDINFRQRYILFTKSKNIAAAKTKGEFSSNPNEYLGYLINKFEIIFDNGFLDSFKIINNENENENIYYAYAMVSERTSWYNNQSYVDTLNEDAIKKFIEVTYEKYFDLLGDEFGKSIPMIFTDEPQYVSYTLINNSMDANDVELPYTEELEDTYYDKYKESILDYLPEVIFEYRDKINFRRYNYINHITNLFSNSYSKNISSWCEGHNIKLSGHMRGEDGLFTQTSHIGEAMRSLQYFHMPGIDVLRDQMDYEMIKQSQSVSRQFNRAGVLSELYGVTNWDYSFKGHKMQGEWQAALGVNFRVHHLSLMTMKGEAKRDYPASINYQSPWCKKYHIIEDHFARINYILSKGKARVRVGVIHPIESFWLFFGPNDKTYEKRNEIETNYKLISRTLLNNTIDYDYISESILEEHGKVNDKFIVANSKYDLVLVPKCITLRRKTKELVDEFIEKGGKVIFFGETPKLIDAKEKFENNNYKIVNFDERNIMDSVEEYRDIKITNSNGVSTKNLFYQLREEEGKRWLYISHGYENISEDFLGMRKSDDYKYIEDIVIEYNGEWYCEKYDTLNGKICAMDFSHNNGKTIINYELSIHESIVVCLTKEKKESVPYKKYKVVDRMKLSAPETITLEEDNVFLLDKCKYKLNNDEWSLEEDLLKVDNICRQKLNYPLKEEARAQPWTANYIDDSNNIVELLFEFESKMPTICKLAIENANDFDISLNNKKIDIEILGHYVDKSIELINLGNLKIGTNSILLKTKYNNKSNIEPIYILGDFGTKVIGKYSEITDKSKKYYFGNLVNQGLAFYSGNLVYKSKINLKAGLAKIKIQYFANPLLEVYVNGENKGVIFCAPYTLDLGRVEGEYVIEIKAYGNRFNTFGQLHNCDKDYNWFASCSWRTKGDRWSDEYQLKENGILVSPEILYLEENQ